MKTMTELFVPYEMAIELKALGFDEPCLGTYYKALQHTFDDPRSGEKIVFNEGNPIHLYTGNFIKDTHSVILCKAITFQQAFKFFREKYGLFYDNLCYIGYVWKFTTYSNNAKDYFQSKEYNTYEEAELACLQKLIEIIKTKQI